MATKWRTWRKWHNKGILLSASGLALLLMLLATSSGLPIPLARAVGDTCVPPPSGLVSWWPGDGNAQDIQNGNHGVLQGGAAYAPGMVGQGFLFNGVDASVSVPDSPGLDMTNAVTLDAWVRWDGPAGSPGPFLGWPGYGTVVTKGQWEGGSPPTFNYSLSVGDDGNVRLLYQATWGMGYKIVGGVTPGVFHHIAGVINPAANEMKIYVDGVSPVAGSGGGDWTLPLLANNLPLTIGRTASGQEFFNGVIDEVEVFDRALTDAEIQAIFNAGSAGKCRACVTPPSGMVSWWPANGSPDDIIDGNSGTLLGGTTFVAGKVDQAFNLDSDDDRVSISHNANLNVPPAGFTVDYWMRGSPTQPQSEFGSGSV